MSVGRDAGARLGKMINGVDALLHKGIEIGALSDPVLDPNCGAVQFVDYTTTDELKKYHAGMPERAARIVNVDYVWAGNSSLAKAAGGSDRFDFALASHVIEHVPNTLGWFRGVLEVLKHGGHFNLALPDKRYTFDINCQVSTIGQLIEADLNNYAVPSIRQMFDHTYRIAAIEPGEIWQRPTDPAQLPPFNGDFALWMAETQAKEIAANGKYYDTHCWIYTPESFLNLIRCACMLERFGFEISTFHDTLPDDYEFFISLRKPEPGIDAETLKWRQVGAIDHHLVTIAETKRRAALAAG